MREIKFRAWDGTRMYHFENHEWTLDFNDISGWNVVKNLPLEQLKGRKWDAGESSDTAEQFQLMQFTGIKDANGKEIYEGDIIMFLDRDWMDYEKDTKRLPVVYEEDKFIIKGGEDKYGQYYEYPLFKSYGRDRFEVIGNIYQNPELTIVSPEQTQPPKTGEQEP